MSDIMGSINITNVVANSSGSRVVVPTPNPPPGGWGSETSLSLAFVNFVLALLTFGIRYASVFWYTNKALTTVFALQLLALFLNSVLGYSAFSCLYKVCYNSPTYINVQLALGCSANLGLYVAGSAVMLISTMTVFEYGSHYFAEKLRIVERKHRGNGDSFVKQTIVVNSGCQGYVPHSCAMAALVVFAVCKGPVIYDLVNLYRPTTDRLVLTGLVCEVCYMVLWIALWFCLTVKQRWQFRILDYVPLGQPLFMIQDDQIVKNPTFDRASGSGSGDANTSLEMDSLPRSRRRSRTGESPPGYLDVVNNDGDGTVPDHDPANSEEGTEDSDNVNVADGVADIDCLPTLPNGGAMRKGVRHGGRRNGGQRVTFDESVRSNNSDRGASGGSGDYAGQLSRQDDGSRHMNVKVDVHNNSLTRPSSGSASAMSHGAAGGVGGGGDAPDSRSGSLTRGGGGGGVSLRKHDGVGDNTLSREYRNSIRSKCDDFYAVVDPGGAGSGINNLSPRPEQPTTPTTPTTTTAPPLNEPLPTLMSSFRDKVKESSRAASSYKEQRRNMQLGNYGSLDRQNLEYPASSSGAGAPPSTSAAVTNGVRDIDLGAGGGLNVLQDRDNYSDKRRGIVEGELGEVTLRLDDSMDSGVRSSKRGSTVSGSDDDPHNHSFNHNYNHNLHHLPPHHPSSHKQSNLTNSTFESENSSLPSITENGQLNIAGVSGADKTGGGGGRHGGGKMDYLTIDKAGEHGFPRHLHIVPRKAEIGRRDSANYSLTSSQETSSNDSDHGQGLCSQV
nr:hypothetical protein BaRGS_034190 [Batillaria attramentaria]